MRISDWSSDVCSSDLIEEAAQQRAGTGAPEHGVIGADVDRQPLHQHVHRRIGRDARAGDQEGEDGRGRIGAHGWGCTFPSPLGGEGYGEDPSCGRTPWGGGPSAGWWRGSDVALLPLRQRFALPPPHGLAPGRTGYTSETSPDTRP